MSWRPRARAVRRRFFGLTSSVKTNRIFVEAPRDPFEDDARSMNGVERARRARGAWLASERAVRREARARLGLWELGAAAARERRETRANV